MAQKRRRSKDDRDGSSFLLIPWVVMDSPAFIGLSAPASRLLLDICRQLRQENNGSLVATMTEMAKRGWVSNDTLTCARRVLEASGLIVQTRMGMRPNVPTLFAVTWRGYDYKPGKHDLPPAQFPRGSYLRNASLKPSAGVARTGIAPSPGVREPSPTPPAGAIEGGADPLPTPYPGDLSRFSHLPPPKAPHPAGASGVNSSN